eukprot:gene8800-biopygen766
MGFPPSSHTQMSVRPSVRAYSAGHSTRPSPAPHWRPPAHRPELTGEPRRARKLTASLSSNEGPELRGPVGNGGLRRLVGRGRRERELGADPHHPSVRFPPAARHRRPVLHHRPHGPQRVAAGRAPPRTACDHFTTYQGCLGTIGAAADSVPAITT